MDWRVKDMDDWLKIKPHYQFSEERFERPERHAVGDRSYVRKAWEMIERENARQGL